MEYKIGMILEGRVTGIQPYGAFVNLGDDTQGLIHISECHHGYIDDIHNYLKTDQLVKVMIIDIDEYTGKISLSVRCLEKPFDFSKRKKKKYIHKKFWTNKHIQEGFKPIAANLDAWVDEALENIKKVSE